MNAAHSVIYILWVIRRSYRPAASTPELITAHSYNLSSICNLKVEVPGMKSLHEVECFSKPSNARFATRTYNMDGIELLD